MRVVVVGAGLSGLMAARRLADAGHDVVVLDKGPSVGGRLATRRIETPAGTARLDHGAQFFTVRSDEVALLVRAWAGQGLVREWCRGFTRGSVDDGTFTAAADGFPRYVVTGGMTALAKHLAEGLDVRCSTLVFAVRPGPDVGAWDVALDDGSSVVADAVVVTCPLPQSYALLVTSGVDLPEDLVRTEYDRTIALLAVLDGPGGVPAPGGVQNGDPVFSWIGDNRAKGVSAVPAVTFHASAEWSEAHWDDDLVSLETLLRDAAGQWLAGATITAAQVKKWRFATPRSIWPDACFVTGSDAAPRSVVLAGDAFAGPRVEGAVLSGLAAADALLLR